MPLRWCSILGCRELSTLLSDSVALEAEGPRRRRMRTLDGWNAPADRVIPHATPEELEAAMEEQRMAALNARYFAESEIVDADHLPKYGRPHLV